MARTNKRIRRQALHGWWKWAPAVAVVFSVVFFDCWLETQRRLQDYLLSELGKEIQAAQRDIEDFTARSAELETLDRLEHMAQDLGLRQPEPGQIKHIYYNPDTDKIVPYAYPFSVARAEGPARHAPNNATLPQQMDIGAELPEAVEVWD